MAPGIEGYGERHDGDGREGRLVSMYTFTEDWADWEMHPHGEELVLCTAGRMTLTQEHRRWHADQQSPSAPANMPSTRPASGTSADVEGEATAVFITAGLGTEGRPR